MLSAKEIETTYRDAMGSELGKIFYELRKQTILLHWNWAEYSELFGKSPERVDTLNRAASSCFRLFQNDSGVIRSFISAALPIPRRVRENRT